MAELFASGRAVDLILAMVILEAVALYAAQRLGLVRGLAAPDWLPGLASGACIMLALRAALAGTDWTWMALPLMTSGAIHLVDLALRRRLRLQAAGAASGSPAGTSLR